MEKRTCYHTKAAASFIAFFLAVLHTGLAQDTTSAPASGTQRFIKAGIGAGTANNLGIYFSISPSEKGFYALDVNHISRKVDEPYGYYGPLICFGDCSPRNNISYISFFAGRYFLFKNKVRFGAAAGPSFVNYKKVHFRERGDRRVGFNLSSKYYTVHSNRIGAGVGLKTMFEFQIVKGLWLEPVFYANINTQHTTYSGNLFVNFELPLKPRNR
jgi:hypothetical protein